MTAPPPETSPGGRADEGRLAAETRLATEEAQREAAAADVARAQAEVAAERRRGETEARLPWGAITESA